MYCFLHFWNKGLVLMFHNKKQFLSCRGFHNPKCDIVLKSKDTADTGSQTVCFGDGAAGMWTDLSKLSHTHSERLLKLQPAGCKPVELITAQKLSQGSLFSLCRHIGLHFIYLHRLTPILFIWHWHLHYTLSWSHTVPDLYTQTKTHTCCVEDIQ